MLYKLWSKGNPIGRKEQVRMHLLLPTKGNINLTIFQETSRMEEKKKAEIGEPIVRTQAVGNPTI